MTVARLLVCERDGYWATALRLAGPPISLRIYELRNLIDCRRELEQSPASLVVVEATRTSIEGVWYLLQETQRSYPQARIVVVGGADVTTWHDLLREAGAVLVVDSPRRLDRVLRLAQRHTERLPRAEMSLRDQVWSRLPWAES